MAYKLSDYGANPNAGRARNNAAQRGWGSGWPNCQWDKFVKISKVGVSVTVRREIAELVATLLTATEQRGYDVCHPPQGACCGTWGVACRAIRGTSVASNHSWGLAIDINAPCNPMSSTFKSNIPPAVVQIWEACGFYWGGRYADRPDAMHFEYIGTPANVAADLERARAYASGATPPVRPPTPAPGPQPPSNTFESYKDDVAPGSRTLRQGNAGDDVAFVQRFIGAAKTGPADGYFGAKTTSGVKSYQRMRGLRQDGIVGAKTWASLLSRAPAPTPAPKPPTATRPTLRQGPLNAATKPHVQALQRHLKKVYPAYAKHLEDDGIFGPKTAAAVKEFQKRSKITADGIVGPVTWGRLGI